MSFAHMTDKQKTSYTYSFNDKITTVIITKLATWHVKLKDLLFYCTVQNCCDIARTLANHSL